MTIVDALMLGSVCLWIGAGWCVCMAIYWDRKAKQYSREAKQYAEEARRLRRIADTLQAIGGSK